MDEPSTLVSGPPDDPGPEPASDDEVVLDPEPSHNLLGDYGDVLGEETDAVPDEDVPRVEEPPTPGLPGRGGTRSYCCFGTTFSWTRNWS